MPTPQTASEGFSLAARLQLSENSRLGFEGKVNPQEPGLLLVNSQSTLGMHVSLRETRGGSRIQTWNRYAYVANNPLSRIDPLGLCADINETECDIRPNEEFERTWWDTTFSAANSQINFSKWDDTLLRMNMGSNYYNLPGHSNPQEQEEARHQSIITSGWDPVLGISRSSLSIDWSTAATTPQEAQKRAVTAGLAEMHCAGNVTVDCAQEVYDSLTVNVLVGTYGLKGGNWNFLLNGVTIDTSLCSFGRCGFVPSLHFNDWNNPTSVHLDTGNPLAFPIGTAIHLAVDLFLGNTIWRQSGIPRH